MAGELRLWDSLREVLLLVLASTTCAEAYENHIYVGEHSKCPGSASAACGKFSEVQHADSVFYSDAHYPDVFADRGRRHAEVLWGTAFTQQAIWEHQHPQTCENVSFLVLEPETMGIGAHLAFLGRALGFAMHTRRILTYLPNETRQSRNGQWFDPELCEGKMSWNCWLEELTNCTLLPFSDRNSAAEHRVLFTRPERLIRRGETGSHFTAHFVPGIFWNPLLDCSCVKPHMRHYWWSTQALTYILRFNALTAGLLQDLRRQRLHVHWRGSSMKRKASYLPSGTIAMFVRHGDKGQEAPLLPFDQYFRASVDLAENTSHLRVLDRELADGNLTFQATPGCYSGRHMFVMTEDPLVIDEAIQTASFSSSPDPWDVFYNEENRTNVDVKTMVKERGARAATLESFLNLWVALEADAWVCTLSSNFCVLIDQLRMTVRGKAHAPYINLLPKGYRRGHGCNRANWQRRCYTPPL